MFRLVASRFLSFSRNLVVAHFTYATTKFPLNDKKQNTVHVTLKKGENHVVCAAFERLY